VGKKGKERDCIRCRSTSTGLASARLWTNRCLAERRRRQTVAASLQAPTLFLIAQDLTRMQVDTNVDEADVGRVRVGQTARFTVDAYPGRPFAGTVTQIRQAPINIQNVVTYDVLVTVANPQLKLFRG